MRERAHQASGSAVLDDNAAGLQAYLGGRETIWHVESRVRRPITDAAVEKLPDEDNAMPSGEVDKSSSGRLRPQHETDSSLAHGGVDPVRCASPTPPNASTRRPSASNVRSQANHDEDEHDRSENDGGRSTSRIATTKSAPSVNVKSKPPRGHATLVASATQGTSARA